MGLNMRAGELVSSEGSLDMSTLRLGLAGWDASPLRGFLPSYLQLDAINIAWAPAVYGALGYE